jgi:PAS domain S-box-containing protein
MIPPSDRFFRRGAARYLVAIAAVAIAFGLRIALTPLTGTGAPFVLFFAAVLVTSLFVGAGAGLAALAISMPLAAYMFVVGAGDTLPHAAFQALLYVVDGLIVVYIAHITTRRRRRLDDANTELRRLNSEVARSAERTREIIDLAPDAFFLANLDARLTDVNRAACELLGYERDELLGMTIFDIIPDEDAPRLVDTRRALQVSGTKIQNEWRLKRKDGTLVPVEASANILDDGRWQAFVRNISERKAIEDQRQVLVSLLDNSVDFIGIADPAGKPMYLNAAGRRMVGLAPDLPIETVQILDCYPRELRPFATDVILKTMLEQGVWSGETFFRNFQTDERIPVSDTHFLIRDASGDRLLGMGTVTRDISDARRHADERERLLKAEEAARRKLEAVNAQLRESEERFRLTSDEAPIGMAIVALDGTFTRVNRVLCEITGYSAAELTQLTFHDITHPDDLRTDVELSGQLARGEIPRYQFEKRYVRKDGRVVDVMLSGSILRGTDDTPTCYIAQIEDISERKRVERALRRSEAMFSGIVSIAADAIISVDTDQRITVFNGGAAQIFGYSNEEMIGAPLERLIPVRYRINHHAHFAQFAAGDQGTRTLGERTPVFGLRKTGEEFAAEGSISKMSVGSEMFFSVVLRDVTSRKRAEEALRRAVAAREDVLGIVAHDLRNPLSVVTMEATSMTYRPGGEPDRRDRKTSELLLTAAGRMNHLIQDLLDVALVEAGQFKVEFAEVRAEDLLQEAAETLRPLAAAANIELRFEIEPDVQRAWGDRKRLLQVCENLIGNAIRFTPSAGRIAVRAAMQEDHVLFSVADTGTGIAADAVPHVFDRFWQATTRTRRLGAGLGLPIAKGIVDAHGGQIWVQSQVGCGTTFFFTIPALPEEAEADTRRSATSDDDRLSTPAA